MAMVKCPECGQEISDKAKRCIHCGKVFAEDKPQTKLCADCGKENPIDAIECIHCGCPFEDGLEKKNSSEMEQELDTQNSKPKSKKNKIIIGIIILAVIFIGIACVALLSQNNSLSINEINISKWKLLDEDGYYDDYEGIVNSDESNSFIAVLGYYEETDDAPVFVYMENGKGVVQVTESTDDDPSIKYTAIGYMNGKIIKESDISSIEYDESDYYDSSYNTSCTVDIDIEMKSKMNGVLFMELKNDLTKDVKRNVAVTIIDGKGEYAYHLSELPLKSRGVEVTAIPKFFCNATDLKENDYTIETPFFVKKNERKYSTSFSGKEELSFEGYDDGLIIYTEELLDGGKKENRGEIIKKVAYLKDNQCILSTFTSGDSDDKILTPTYNIQIVGYLKWNNYNKK